MILGSSRYERVIKGNRKIVRWSSRSEDFSTTNKKSIGEKRRAIP